MDTTALQKMEVTIPTIDVDLLKDLANKYGWKVKAKVKKNEIDKSLEDIAAGRVYTAKNVDDLMNHLLK